MRVTVCIIGEFFPVTIIRVTLVRTGATYREQSQELERSEFLFWFIGTSSANIARLSGYVAFTKDVRWNHDSYSSVLIFGKFLFAGSEEIHEDLRCDYRGLQSCGPTIK